MLTWIFDLDNTLHDATPHIMPHINRSMTEYVQRQLAPVAAAPGALLRAGVLDEDAAHRLCRRREEVAAPGPVGGVVVALAAADQSQVGLVDQRRGLERLSGPLRRHPHGRQAAQLVVHQRQQLPRGVGVAALDGRQDAGDLLVHGLLRPAQSYPRQSADRSVT